MNPKHNILGLEVRMEFFEWHHLYLGIVMLIAGIVLLVLSQWLLGAVLCALGLILIIDDLYQHHRQVDEPFYHSPLHQLYGKLLYHIPFVRWLNRQADDFMRWLGR